MTPEPPPPPPSEPPPSPPPEPLNWLTNAAWILAALYASFFLVSALYTPIVLFFALIIAIGAWGIRKGRAWSAFGLAIFTLALFTISLVGMVEADPEHLRKLGMDRWFFVLPAALQLAFVLILCLAGRRLWHSNPRGAPWGWLALSLPIFVFPFVARLFVIPTGAMEDTILIGDHLVVSRSSGSPPKRGDIVVFRYPIDRRQTFIKRVVAIAGDHLRIERKQLYLNGKPAAEPYVVHKTEYMDTYRDNFPSEPNVRLYDPAAEMLATAIVNGEVVVPQGKLFVMGDNRDSSLDSRYWGFLDTSDIIGRTLVVYFSVDLPTEKPRESPPQVLLHPSWIRWSRIGKTF